MCDYSLEVYRSRPAVIGEWYGLHRFRTGSMGFVADGDCNTAVCMPAGVRLRLQGLSSAVQRAFGVGSDEDVVTLCLPRRGNLHRDAVRFANGRQATLQCLNAGVRATLMRRDLTELFQLEGAGDRELV